MEIRKTLIVEDQERPLKLLREAVEDTLPNSRIDEARSYTSARNQIMQENYDLILLDDRMPYNDLIGLEQSDLKEYSNHLESLGYSLAPEIRERNPNAIIIGTSSDAVKVDSLDWAVNKWDVEDKINSLKKMKGCMF
jgi:CheY-like chemotaxis protein